MPLSNLNMSETPIANSISDRVYQTLKKAIVRGELKPGSRLRVLDIASKFDISQAPVREALERLKQEELVVGKPNKGSVVSDITLKEIRDVYGLRMLLEDYAVRETMARLQGEQFAPLDDIMERMKQAAEEDDPYQIVELDMEFHGFFYKNCNNEQINHIWNNIKVKIARFIAVTNNMYSKELLVAGHALLLDIVKQGDADLLVEKLHRTLHNQLHIIDSMLSGNDYNEVRKQFVHE